MTHFLYQKVYLLNYNRLSKHLVRNLIQLLTPHLRRITTVRGITATKRIFIALQFYATGSYQRSLGEQYNFGMSKSYIHIAIHEVTVAITNNLAPTFIKFPVTVDERTNLKEQFHQLYGFPGTIDCTHIAILKPRSEEEHNFYNRKGYHSINYQLICDGRLKIMNVLANFGGASHDSFIWSRSQIKQFMETNLDHREQAWLVGDSGYPQSKTIMTPFRNPVEGSPEARYNAAHMRARNVIERCNGVLKSRFRCLSRERISRYTPQFVCDIIKACVVLHNMCLGENVWIDYEAAHDDKQNIPNAAEDHGYHEGLLVRQQLVNGYFRN